MKETRIREIVRRADLHINGTAQRCEGGIPIGNGITGTLVWTSPTALKMQVNRNDVYANDSYSNSFNERHYDYGYSCGFVDIDFADFSPEVFTENTRQHLDLYEAQGNIIGEGVKSSFFACEGTDVLAFRITDQRSCFDGINIKLKMLRDAEVRSKSHLAVSRFVILEDIMVLVQEFSEKDYFCTSAVAVQVKGRAGRIRCNNESGGRKPGIADREPILLGQENEREIRLCLEPGPGEFEVFVSSCSSFSRGDDVAKRAADMVRRSADKGYEKLKEEQAQVWEKYWEKSYVELWGTAEAELAETNYQYFMYIMGCCSRNGHYAPNFGGLLFSPRGDLRHWGTMQWWNNLSLYYNAVLASGRFELDMPYFEHWNNMFDRLKIAAKQQWDSEGIFIPEVVGFDGPEILPEDIARELSDLMLLRKPWSERSEKFWKFAFTKRPHESRWNFKHYESWKEGEQLISSRGAGVFNFTTHMLGSQVGIAYEYWKYFRYSGDRDYLERYGYPIMKGVAEFFRTYPNLRKGEDGRIHSYHTNCGEGFYNCTDSMEVLSAVHGILPIALRAAEILEVDPELRREWKEMYDQLAPLPVSTDSRIKNCTIDSEEAVWVSAVCDYFKEEENPISGVNIQPMNTCEMCKLETQYTNPELFKAGKASLAWILNKYPIDSRRFVYEMSKMGAVLAGMGYGDEMGRVITAQSKCINAEQEYCYYENNGRTPYFENRLTAREGINAISAQRLGNISYAIQQGLLQSDGGSPTAEPVLRLFPALPGGWNARFLLYAQGGFRVEASCEKGVLQNAVITSSLGQKLRVRNQGNADMQAVADGRSVRIPAGGLLEMDTAVGSVIRLEVC